MNVTLNSSTNLSPKLGDDTFDGKLNIYLSPNILKELAQIDVVKASFAISSEWIAIFIAIIFCHYFWHPIFYILVIIFIGGRQHALGVLQHDAAHYRLLPNKVWNDIVAETLLAWPILLSNQYFRSYHFQHHRYLGTEKDGNRSQYRTHTLTGELTPAWTFPKNKINFTVWLLLCLCGTVGILYLLRSCYVIFTKGSLRYRLLNLAYYVVIVGLVLWLQIGQFFILYWLIPLCTWFVFTNLLRIAGEHSAIENQATEDQKGFYRLTRTTLPSWFDRIFLVPRNISYHVEHHLFPHIPFYRLPELHAQLMEQGDFQKQAHVTRTYCKTLKELVV